jgi:hypothetical protein
MPLVKNMNVEHSLIRKAKKPKRANEANLALTKRFKIVAKSATAN